MYTWGHFAIGLLCGALIMSPFVISRYIYDYDKHKWIPIKFAKVELHPDGATVLAGSDRAVELATAEILPQTYSLFVPKLLTVSCICGLIAMLPDLGELWGDSTTDDYWWADFFFFHRTLDNYTETYSGSIMLELLLLALAITFLLLLISISTYIQCRYPTVS